MPPKNTTSRKPRSGRGLDVELHPALASSNANIIKAQQKQVNPYLSDIGQQNGKVFKKYKDGLRFYKKGEISAQLHKEREELARRLKEEELRAAAEKAHRVSLAEQKRERIANAEIPDDSIGEELYMQRFKDIPNYEWWDESYLDKSGNILPKYTTEYPEDIDSDYDSDDMNSGVECMKSQTEETGPPSIRYVQHPVPIKIPEEITAPKMYLTKLEHKKARRRNRKLQREEKMAKVQLGLEPKPETKVKLSNMMNVLDNDKNISDPTAWENMVKDQIEERRQRHIQENEKRHEEAVLRKKSKVSDQIEGSEDLFCKAFYFQSLQNPKIRYKLKMNSQQLNLKGFCLRVGEGGPGIIVVIGKEKSCNFYKKLVCTRIKWNENFKIKDATNNGELIDMTGNYAVEIWDGLLKETKLRNWFMKICQTEDEMKNILQQNDALSFFNLFIENKAENTNLSQQ